MPRLIPSVPPPKTFPYVPADIGAAAGEAYRCQNSGSHRAAVLMARSVVEAAAKARNVTEGSLLSKIDKLPQLRQHVREGAHEIRLLGNDMAHGDLGALVSAAEAGLVIRLMDDVLEDVFQSPARAAEAKANRESKKLMEQRLAAIREGKPDPGLSPAIQSIILQLGNDRVGRNGQFSASPQRRSPGSSTG
jgi:hypothetical protein